MASTSLAHWQNLKKKITLLAWGDGPIPYRWRSIQESDWGTLPDKPSPLVVDNVSKQLSIRRAFLRASRAHPQGGPGRPARITLHIRPNRSGHKWKTHPTVEPLRGSDALGDKAAIHQIVARSEPMRIKHGRRSTWVDEFQVRWNPKECTFGEALE